MMITFAPPTARHARMPTATDQRLSRYEQRRAQRVERHSDCDALATACGAFAVAAACLAGLLALCGASSAWVRLCLAVAVALLSAAHLTLAWDVWHEWRYGQWLRTRV